MFSESRLSSELIAAYRATVYRVDAEPPFSLEIGKRSQALAELMQHHVKLTAAYLTAFNPYSQPLSFEQNQHRQEQLVEELRQRGLLVISGQGQVADSDWPPEDSCMVLGLDLETAKRLAHLHEQNAFVWCGPDATPQLVLLK